MGLYCIASCSDQGTIVADKNCEKIHYIADNI